MATGGLGAYRNAIASIESGGNYRAIGPVTKGDRPYGKYQVMGRNIPAWSREVLGFEVTPEQFLADPQVQDAVFDGKFGSYVQKYGPVGAAQAWIGGEGSVGKTGRKDVLGTSVGQYGQRFAQALGLPSSSYGVGPGFKGENPNYTAPPVLAAGGLGASPRAAEEEGPAASGREALAGLGTPMLSEEEMLALALQAMQRRHVAPGELPAPVKIKRTPAQAPRRFG